MKILAVDGGDRVLAAHFELLRRTGHEVTQAQSFEVAREMLLRGDQHFDLLITNRRLKAYNGLHLVSCTQSFCAHVAAIVVDNAADAFSESEAYRFGAYYLAGPVESDELQAMVKAAAARRPLRPSPRAVLQPVLRPSDERAPLETAETAYGTGIFGEN